MMLVDCCMLSFRACGPIAAVGVVHAYVGQKVLKRYIILIFSNFTVSQN